MPKQQLHPALQANADRLRRREPLFDTSSKARAKAKAQEAQRPKIRTKKKV